MSDIIGIITKVEDDDYQGKAHKKVTLGEGQVLKVKYGRDGALKAKWGLLQEGVAMKFIMRDYTTPDQVKIPFVFDIETVDSALLEPQEPQVLPEHKKVVADAKPSEDPPRDSAPIAPQEQGMWFKEIGELYRAGLIKKDSPEGLALIAIYFARMKKVMGIETEKK